MNVSVIIPVRDGKKYIDEAIVSVRTQSLSEVEIIVVDDGSTDGVAEYLEGTYGGYRFRVISTKPTGRSAARNTGVEAAKGRYVAFLDADDVWESSKLRKQVYVMEKFNADMSYTWSYQIDERGQALAILREEGDFVQPGFPARALSVCLDNSALTVRRFERADLFYRCLEGYCLQVPSTWVFKRDKFPGFDERLDGVEDWELSIRISDGLRVACVNEPLTAYRTYGVNFLEKLYVMGVCDRLHVMAENGYALSDVRATMFKAYCYAFAGLVSIAGGENDEGACMIRVACDHCPPFFFDGWINGFACEGGGFPTLVSVCASRIDDRGEADLAEKNAFVAEVFKNFRKEPIGALEQEAYDAVIGWHEGGKG